MFEAKRGSAKRANDDEPLGTMTQRVTLEPLHGGSGL
jgi:hypothetical protein